VIDKFKKQHECRDKNNTLFKECKNANSTNTNTTTTTTNNNNNISGNRIVTIMKPENVHI
jgi:hypothetical protein